MNILEMEIEKLSKEYNEERKKEKPDIKLLSELLMSIYRLKIDLSFVTSKVTEDKK